MEHRHRRRSGLRRAGSTAVAAAGAMILVVGLSQLGTASPGTGTAQRTTAAAARPMENLGAASWPCTPADTTVRVREAADGTLVTVPDPGTSALLTVHGPHGPVRVLVLSAEQGRQVSRVHIWGCDRLVLCDDLVLADGEELRVHTAAAPDIALLPAPPGLTGTTAGPGVRDGAFTRWILSPPASVPPPAPAVTCARSEAVAAPARTGDSHGRASAPLDADFERASVHHIAVLPEVFDESGEAG